MSKSKGNVVDPADMINTYGADATRLFCLFAAPPEKDMDWSDQGIEGSYRFLGRLWRLVDELKDRLKGLEVEPGSNTGKLELEGIKKKTHQTIKKVTEDIDKRFRFNTAIASMMELVNELYKVKDTIPDKREELAVIKEAIENLVIMLSPFVPHIADELWHMLGHKGMLLEHPWPEYDAGWAEKTTITLAVQVNGKLRATLKVAKDILEEDATHMALSEQNVKRFVNNNKVVRVIYVPNRIINIITATR